MIVNNFQAAIEYGKTQLGEDAVVVKDFFSTSGLVVYSEEDMTSYLVKLGWKPEFFNEQIEIVWEEDEIYDGLWELRMKPVNAPKHWQFTGFEIISSKTYQKLAKKMSRDFEWLSR